MLLEFIRNRTLGQITKSDPLTPLQTAESFATQLHHNSDQAIALNRRYDEMMTIGVNGHK